MHVNIIAIPALSVKLGYRPKKGNTSNCNTVANIKPLPTSMKLSTKLRTCPRKHYRIGLVVLLLYQIRLQTMVCSFCV